MLIKEAKQSLKRNKIIFAESKYLHNNKYLYYFPSSYIYITAITAIFFNEAGKSASIIREY